MRKFRFPGGKVWALADSEEIVLVELEGGHKTVLVFSDDDLATRYAQDGSLNGKVAKIIKGNLEMLLFLGRMKSLGVTHVAVDSTFGKGTHFAHIDKAIRDVAKRIG